MLAGFDVGLAIALSGVAVSVIGWFRSQTRSQYARERDYAHIMRNQEQEQQAIAELAHEVDTIGDRLTKIEALMISAVRGGGING
jgi:uncharacterized protein YaaR (DUF327 family)